MKKPHKNLDVWNASLDLVSSVYQATNHYPKEERFCLVDQTRRAALSIPSNIAEGAARQTRKEFINYLHISKGSLSELDAQLEAAKRLGFLHEETWTNLDERMGRIDQMLSGLIRHLRNGTGSKK